MVPTDFDTGQNQECPMDRGGFVIPYPESTVLMQPRQRAFHRPPVFSQAAPMGCPPFGQDRFNPPLAKSPTVRLRIIGPISLNTIWPFPRTPNFAGDGRNGIDQGEQLGHIVSIGFGDGDRQWNSIGIGDHMVFGALFPPVRGIGAGFRPPKTARTELESTNAREKSIRSAPRRWFSRSRWIRSQTPAFCHSRSRRQQVIPQPQPISWGRSSQGMPVLRTNKMPVRVFRLGIRLHPGYRNRRFLTGIRGSIIVHNPSSSNGLAMSRLPVSVGFGYSCYRTLVF